MVIKIIEGHEPAVFRQKIAEYYKNIVEANGHELKITPQLVAAADAIANAVKNDRSVFLCGGIGTGKTTFANAVKMAGEFFFKHKRGARIPIVMASDLDDLDCEDVARDAIGVSIDDVGCEPSEVVQFGTRRNIVADIICIRYERRRFTMITTNLAPAQIKERYGARVADRLSELYDIVILDGVSYRKNK